uniref:Uncharacterized protein n=1 Tax=Peronospora matthiolae TaxID=2874970 RepID=A0AAV1UYJ8_9STRA
MHLRDDNDELDDILDMLGPDSRRIRIRWSTMTTLEKPAAELRQVSSLIDRHTTLPNTTPFRTELELAALEFCQIRIASPFSRMELSE